MTPPDAPPISAPAAEPAGARVPGWLVGTFCVGVALWALLSLRHRVGGIDQWILPTLATVKGCYLASVVLFLLGLRFRTIRPALLVLLVGFVASAFLVVLRGLEAGRWPSQSKFEVFFNTSMTVPIVLLLLFVRFDLARAEGRRRVVAASVGATVVGFALMWVLIASKEDY